MYSVCPPPPLLLAFPDMYHLGFYCLLFAILLYPPRYTCNYNMPLTHYHAPPRDATASLGAFLGAWLIFEKVSVLIYDYKCFTRMMSQPDAKGVVNMGPVLGHREQSIT